MLNPTELDERKYLEAVRKSLGDHVSKIDEDVRKRADELQENKRYLQENKAGMDHVEKVNVRESIYQSALIGEASVAKKNRVAKLMASPYFGRLDFREQDAAESVPYYIGLHAFFDEFQNANLIHDWRAPLSSMFYDYELGEAAYAAPSGAITGEITLKRQFRIRNGQMQFMIESGLNILDDILQEELSKTSDDRMKTIVATIQRDQNAIIRNESSRALIIQGVAGSGKTSIALHRIAFLLYRFRGDIQSGDILIISPNKVFADYISNVLPELGEERIPEKGMEDLAREALEDKFPFQSFFEQVGLLLEKNDPAFAERIRFKASNAFLNKLRQYLLHIETNYFQAEDVRIKRNYLVPAWYIEERFRAYERTPIFNRFQQVAADIEENVRFFYKYEISAAERNDLRKAVRRMFRIATLRALYKDFYEWLGMPELFKPAKGARLEYADVFPLIFMKIHLEGAGEYKKVKHLLVDEMQDYSAVQYAVLARLFRCKMTILGDIGQSVNPYSASSAEEIAKVFPGAEVVRLNKCYRSTYEIARFAQGISPNEELDPVRRHGPQPGLHGFPDAGAELDRIAQLIEDFKTSDHRTLGVVCKTFSQAQALHEALKNRVAGLRILSEESVSFSDGVIVTAAHLSKGLEFDRVIAPHAGAKNYRTPVDKSMLYIACTRAMHRLDLTYVKEKTEFINYKGGDHTKLADGALHATPPAPAPSLS